MTSTSSRSTERSRRRGARSLSLGLAAVAWLLVGAAPGADMSALLASIQSHYDTIRTLGASFEQKSRVASLGRDEVASGRVLVERPGRMRWEYELPQANVILVDGESVRIYSPVERKLQIAPLGPQALSPTALGFLLGEGRLVETFSGERLESSDPTELRLRLVPLAEAGFEHLELRLDAASHALRGSVLVDLFGNRTELLFHDVGENRPLPSDAFELRVPDGTDVIDLR